MTFKYWISTITALSVALAMAGSTTAPSAEEAAAAPQSAWDKCLDTLENMPDYWTGWRRDFHNGYADSFEFYNSDGEYESPAVLVTDFTIDDTAYETVTSCFEGGKLSYVNTVMRSANTSGEAGTQAERHGEIYLDATGKVTKTLGWLENGGLDDKMKPITFPLNDKGYQLTRDCRPVALYKTTDDVQKALDATLGDIDGKRPDFTAEDYDWCTAAVAP
jgi:hypothetical protein